MRLLEFAVVSRASDIHLEPYELELLVRYRIDGALQEVVSLPPATQGPVASRLKVMAELMVYRTDVPQEGRLTLADGRELTVSLVDVRTDFEFRAGNFAGSTHVPINDIYSEGCPATLAKLPKEGFVVFVCATVRCPRLLQAKAKALSASANVTPPCNMPWPLQ